MKSSNNTSKNKRNPISQYQVRASIVCLLNLGLANATIAEKLNVSERHVRAVKKQYAEGGMEALRPKKRGPKCGENRVLTPEQEREIWQSMIETEPSHLAGEERLWTRQAVLDFLRRNYGLRTELSTLGYYFRRWGLTVERPANRIDGQERGSIDQWLDTEFPGIAKEAREKGADIVFVDITELPNPFDDRGDGTPEGSSDRLYMLSAMTKRGKLRFALYREAVTAEGLIDFLERLAHDSGGTVYLMVEDFPIWQAKSVQSWLENHRERVDVFYLSSD